MSVRELIVDILDQSYDLMPSNQFLGQSSIVGKLFGTGNLDDPELMLEYWDKWMHILAHDICLQYAISYYRKTIGFLVRFKKLEMFFELLNIICL